MSKRRLVSPRKPEPVPLETQEPDELFTFSLTVRYTAVIMAPNARVARERLYVMFQWLHDGIGRWLVPMPPAGYLRQHWVEFPDTEDFKACLPTGENSRVSE